MPLTAAKCRCFAHPSNEQTADVPAQVARNRFCLFSSRFSLGFFSSLVSSPFPFSFSFSSWFLLIFLKMFTNFKIFHVFQKMFAFQQFFTIFNKRFKSFQKLFESAVAVSSYGFTLPISHYQYSAQAANNSHLSQV